MHAKPHRSSLTRIKSHELKETKARARKTLAFLYLRLCVCLFGPTILVELKLGLELGLGFWGWILLHNLIDQYIGFYLYVSITQLVLILSRSR